MDLRSSFLPFRLMGRLFRFGAAGAAYLWRKIFNGTLPATGTFTRASTAYHQQPDGTWVAVASGEARYSGMRRVRNLVNGTTSNLSTGFSDISVGTTTRTGGQPDPFGGNGASLLVGNNTNTWWASQKSLSASANTAGVFTISCYLKSDGANSCQLIANCPGGDKILLTKTLSTEWVRYSITGTIGTIGNGVVFALNVGNGVNVYAYGAQIEIGDSCSEYVSFGVLSAPYHGTGVDGVKYFYNDNGNTVTSNVVTEAQGAALPGPFGLLMEPAATNLCLQSESLNVTWYLSDAANMENVVANQYTSPDGALTAAKLQTKATTASRWVQQNLPGAAWTAAQTTFSAHLKYINHAWVALAATDGSNQLIGSFNIQTGALGSTTSGVTTRISSLADGWYRCELTFTPAAGGNLIYIAINGSDSATLQSWTALGTETVAAWGVLVEVGSVATSYIPTTTTAVARAVDALAITGITADNEARITYTDDTTADLDDWDGTMPTPTAPVVVEDVTVYAPGKRPA